MAKTILTGARIFAGGADLTGASNKAELSAEVEEKDVTTFASNKWNEVVGGLASGQFKGSGYWESGDAGKVDDEMWANVGGVGVPYSVGPTAATVGSLVYFMKAMRTDYTLLGEVGEVAPWESSATTNWPMVRGQFAHPPGTARTSSGNGSAVELVAVPAGKRLYAAVHVLAAAGVDATADVTVESAATADFADPVTRLTFSQASGISSQILRTDGTAITDTYFRIAWTIAGTSPSFSFVAALGVA
ncbi:hypothetical protein [Streptomyces sp. NBC_00525]|uniref:hypothetical protein n=1 Tax=Streptomyces sp. NBC_00525 TaxID=2903660 RepID=UPI002E81A790|nr:hypothetical protein [Streptomyces sp. NBC_00525]WUC97416.1 hypothetical protein OG710_29050 [Streptomyces sp. NBC_00525]